MLCECTCTALFCAFIFSLFLFLFCHVDNSHFIFATIVPSRLSFFDRYIEQLVDYVRFPVISLYPGGYRAAAVSYISLVSFSSSFWPSTKEKTTTRFSPCCGQSAWRWRRFRPAGSKREEESNAATVNTTAVRQSRKKRHARLHTEDFSL